MAERVIGAREFRRTWTTLTEATVAVAVHRREIGFWVPVGTEEWEWISESRKDEPSGRSSPSRASGSTSTTGEAQTS